VRPTVWRTAEPERGSELRGEPLGGARLPGLVHGDGTGAEARAPPGGAVSTDMVRLLPGGRLEVRGDGWVERSSIGPRRRGRPSPGRRPV